MENKAREITTKSFKGLKLKKFPDLSDCKQYDLLNFGFNPLQNFSGMISLPFLKDLYLDNTNISSFLGAPELPSLRTISIKSTPINSYKKVDLMCAIVFGPQLTFVNGEEVKKDRVKFSKQYREILLPYFRDSWILTSINPVRFINQSTRQRIAVKLPSPKLSDYQSPNVYLVPKKTETINNAEEEDFDEKEHSIHLVYDAEESASSNHLKATNTIKELNQELAKTYRKKATNVKTVVDEMENKKKYQKNSTSLRSLLREPGGSQDPFTFHYTITTEKRNIPELFLETAKTKKGLVLSVNKSHPKPENQKANTYNVNYTPKDSSNDYDLSSASFPNEDQ